MASGIDLGTVVLGAAIGYGLHEEIKDTMAIGRNAILAGVAGAALTAAQQQQQNQPKPKPRRKHP